MDAASFGNGRARCSTIYEIPLPRALGYSVQIPRISRRRKVKRPARGHSVDGPRDDSVLKGRFIEIADVVNDNVAAVAVEVEDVLGEAGLADKGGGEVERRSRGKIVNDFEHGCAFAAPGHAALSRQHGDWPQMAQRLRIGQEVHAIGAQPPLD